MPRPKKPENEATLAISIRVPPEMKEEILKLAKQTHRSLNEMTVHILEVGLDVVRQDQRPKGE